MFKTYYYLTKPGIIYGNIITTIGGFFLASKGNLDFRLLFATTFGMSLIIASACVINNIFDREIDQRMERTKNRALATGRISKSNALTFATILGLLGLTALLLFTNYLLLSIALLGWLVYVTVYTPLKHKTMHATLIGSICGATPIAGGYLAVTNRVDLGAIILFLILVCWQMPHFYAIAIRRLDEYQAAAIPVLPAKKGIAATKKYVLCYVILFIIATSSLYFFHYTGKIYFWAMLVLGFSWLYRSIRGFRPEVDTKLWARQMFLFSLAILLIFSFTISIDAIIPS